MCRWSQRKWLWWTSPQGEKTALSTTFWILAVSDPGVSSQESGVTRLVILERCAIMKVLNYRWTAVFGLKNEVSMWGEFPLCDALALSEWSDRAFKNFSPFFFEMVGCWTDKQMLLMVLLMCFPIFFSVLFLVTVARHLGVHFLEGWICRGSPPNTSINVHKTKCWPNLLVLLPRLYIQFNCIFRVYLEELEGLPT